MVPSVTTLLLVLATVSQTPTVPPPLHDPQVTIVTTQLIDIELESMVVPEVVEQPEEAQNNNIIVLPFYIKKIEKITKNP